MAVRWMEYALSEYSLILAEREEAEASLGKHPSSQSLSSVTESEDDVLLRAFQRLWAKSRESYHWLASLLHRHGSKYFEGRHTAAWKQQGWLALRASLLAYGIKTALVILPQLARGRIRSLAQFLNRKIWFPSSTLRLAGFFGSFVLAHASMESLRLPAWSSGLAAGLTLAIAPRSNRLPIALFGFVRALEVFGRWLCTEGYFPRMEHGDTILMTLASIQCVYAWIYEPQSLDPSYLSFLYKFGGHPIPIVKAVCANTRGLPVQEAEVFPILRKQGLCTEWDDPRFCIPRGGHWCQLAHPASTSCTASYLRFWIRSYRQSLGLYTPVFLLPLVLRLTQRLKGSKGRNSRNRSRSTFPIATSSEAEVEETQIRNPSAALQCARTLGPLQEFRSRILRPELHSPGGRVSFQRFLVSRLARFALSVARSATFLATYCSNGWGSVCFYAAVRGSVHPSAGEPSSSFSSEFETTFLTFVSFSFVLV